MPRFAAIDVGSNALRLRVVEAASPPLDAAIAREQLPLLADGSRDGGRWREVLTTRAAVRLGTDVFVSGKLSPASIGQACDALRGFREILDREKVDAYRATATSAVREARNGATLVERARREAGVEIDVIEGVEEARLIQLAVTRKLALGDKRAALIDVGGGSTEVTLIDSGRHRFSVSLALGTVRLLDTYLRDAKTVDHLREKLLVEAIDRAIDELDSDFKGQAIDLLIGTGGSVETLADLCPAKGTTRAIDSAAMRVLFKRMCRMTAMERKDALSLRPDRADTIVPACAIFLRIAEFFSKATIVVPGVGLTAGILEELIDKYFHVWDTVGEAENVLSACTRLGKRYDIDEAHGRIVAKFAAQLFDDLQSIHAFGERERLLLRAAALLHDIGDYVRYDGHHKHSYYLIQHADIMGLSRDERSIVANIARYHRKSPPDPSHPNFRDLDKEARGKVRGLAAILRIADALDREHRGKIEGVRAAIDRANGTVTLFLRGEQERELEEWTVSAKSELLRDVYDLDVHVAKGEVNE